MISYTEDVSIWIKIIPYSGILIVFFIAFAIQALLIKKARMIYKMIVPCLWFIASVIMLLFYNSDIYEGCISINNVYLFILLNIPTIILLLLTYFSKLKNK